MQNLIWRKAESNTDEEESTASSEISEDYAPSDTSTEDDEESEAIETLQVHNVCNKSTHHEDDS